LLDEPLAALDAKLRHTMQSELKRIQSELGFTFVFVTHDQREAFAMSDRVAIMNGGQLEQVGPPVALYRTPASRFVADFVGHSNFLTGAVGRQGSQCSLVSGPGSIVWLPSDPGRDTCTLLVRPEHLTLRVSSAGLGDGINRVKGVVTERRYLGSQLSYTVDCGVHGPITVETSDLGNSAAHVAPGADVWLTWDRDVATIIPD
jgi:spermidine/putrescine transport system ATP-binding protein